MLRSLTFLTFCLCLVSSYAQEFIVKEELTADQFDVTAQSKPRMDLAGHACALVKVWCALDGVRFTGNTIGDPLYSDGEYWVYVTQGSKQLTIRHARVLPTTIHFAPLQGGVTYRLTLQLPESLYGLLFNPSASSQPVQPQPAPPQPQPAQPDPQLAQPDPQLAQPDPQLAQYERETLLQQQAEIMESRLALSAPDTTITVNGVSFKMIRVEGGTFQMGSNEWSDTQPVHSVTLSDYYIGETEVTVALWTAVMGNNPSKFKIDGWPIYRDWDDCQTFIKSLNTITGLKFRLPTEAEWEFAARGGNQSHGYRYSGSDSLGEVAWYKTNSFFTGTCREVKSKQSNELGLFDMSGNISEWCQDFYGSYSGESQINPTGPSFGHDRVYRGGNIGSGAAACSVARRDKCRPDGHSQRNGIGLRLALDE